MLAGRGSEKSDFPPYVIAPGTQVVLKVELPLACVPDVAVDGISRFKQAGAVGVVQECPQQADSPYLVTFTDGTSVMATFSQLALRRREIDNILSQAPSGLLQHVIYKAQVGSKAFGLSHEESDDDIRGIFVAPAEAHWSLYTVPEQIEHLDEERDEVFWEIEKFLRLALKANPSVLEVLWTPLVLESNAIGDQLLAIRDSFLSKHLYRTYSGYVLSQFRRMQNSHEKGGTFKVKHAMHLIRLLYSGIAAVQTGVIRVDVGEQRDELLSIRKGNWTFEEIRTRAFELDKEFQAAFETTRLPDQPNFALVDQFLIQVRRDAASR